MGKKYQEEFDGQEPSFSIYDFKKWLKDEGVDPDDDLQKESMQEIHKEKMKEKFKDNFKEKIKKRKNKD